MGEKRVNILFLMFTALKVTKRVQAVDLGYRETTVMHSWHKWHTVLSSQDRHIDFFFFSKQCVQGYIDFTTGSAIVMHGTKWIPSK